MCVQITKQHSDRFFYVQPADTRSPEGWINTEKDPEIVSSPQIEFADKAPGFRGGQARVPAASPIP